MKIKIVSAEKILTEKPFDELWLQLRLFENEYYSKQFLMEKYPGIMDDDDEFNKLLEFFTSNIKQAYEYYSAASKVSILTSPLLYYYGMMCLTNVLWASLERTKDISEDHGLQSKSKESKESEGSESLDHLFSNEYLIVHKKGSFPALHQCFSDFPIKETYLFSWDEISGEDNERLIEFLIQKFGVDWVKIAKIEKIDDGKTIKVSNENNYLSLILNEKNKDKKIINVYIKEIEDDRTYEFKTKAENGRLNIYENTKFYVKDILSVIPELKRLYEEIYHEKSRLIEFTGRNNILFSWYDNDSRFKEVFKRNQDFFKNHNVEFYSGLFDLDDEFHGIKFPSLLVNTPFDYPLQKSMNGEIYFTLPIEFEKKAYAIPEASAHFMVMHCLGMLVRYEPVKWHQIVSGKSSSDIILINRFIDISKRKFPNMILNGLLGKEMQFIMNNENTVADPYYYANANKRNYNSS